MMEISFTFIEQVLKILVIPWPLHLVKTDATFLEKKNSECQLVHIFVNLQLHVYLCMKKDMTVNLVNLNP